jgi:hypothetical protein
MADHPFPDAAMLTDRFQRLAADILTMAEADSVIAALAVSMIGIALAAVIILLRLARLRKDEARATSATVRKRPPSVDLKKPAPTTDQKARAAPERVARHMPPRIEGRPLVLHVDDSPSTLRLIAQAFSAKADVRSVASASEAMSEMDAARPDVVILEPGLAGDGVDGGRAEPRLR